VNGAGALVTVNDEVAARSELVRSPVRTRLARAVVDRRSVRHRAPRRIQPEISGCRGPCNRYVYDQRSGVRRDPALPRHRKYPIGVGEERGTPVRTLQAARVDDAAGSQSVKACRRLTCRRRSCGHRQKNEEGGVELGAYVLPCPPATGSTRRGLLKFVQFGSRLRS
jgi:hypothetical protein